jgi:hypothetical protein
MRLVTVPAGLVPSAVTTIHNVSVSPAPSGRSLQNEPNTVPSPMTAIRASEPETLRPYTPRYRDLVS